MQPFAASMFPHRVYVKPLTEGLDTVATVSEDFPATSGLTPIPCRVRLSGAWQTPMGAGDGEVTTTKAQVAFPADPGLAKGSQLQRTTDGLRLRCLAPARARDGNGVLFVAECEVID